MKKCLYFFVGGLLLASSAHAEMIQGTIAFVDATNQMISVRPFDTSKYGPTQLLVKLKEDTKTRNVDSTDELTEGQEVRVDAHQNRAQNVLEARSIEVTGPEEPEKI